MTRRTMRPVVVIATLGLAVVLAAHRRVTTQTTTGCAPDNAGLTLPPGFCAGIFADSLGGVRHMAIAANGDVLVIRQNRPRGDTTGGGVLVLRDANADGRAEQVGNFGPVGGTGIALDGSSLYVDARTAILRYPFTSGATAPSAAPDTIVKGLPTGGHAARNFALDGRGSMYVNIGSATNVCQQGARPSAGVTGADPCVELETRAGIWKFSSSQLGQEFSPGARFATGIRNAVGLVWHPTERALYSTQHGRDNLFQHWPELYNEQRSADQPAEEFMRVSQGDDFGWPYCYFDTDLKRLVLAPEYGGNASEAGRCATKKAPVVAFPGHWAPNGLLFYTGSSFPARYRDGAFIAFHGSWNRAPKEQAGYKVVFAPATKGTYSGRYETFADNFANGKLDPSRAEHRPTGLATARDGALLVTDDRGGRIYRIRYVGTR
ncbi:MAG: PQQ-dependent sugar dehydrogenase [Gemmatimonas sp.]